MTGRVGYDLERVRRLRWESVRACARLDQLRSPDPIADDATLSIGRLREIIEHGWLPTIDAVVDVDPLGGAWTGLSGWATGTITGVEHGDTGSPWRDASRSELLAELERLDVALPWSAPGFPDLDRLLDSPFTELADEIARRSADDPTLAGELVDRFASTPIVGLVPLVASYPAGLAADLIAAGLERTSYVDDLPTRTHAAAIAALLDSLTVHPDVVLDLLDRAVLTELVRWPFLPPELVADVVLTGLLLPAHRPDRLADGQSVLRHLVHIANDPFVDRTTLPGPLAAALAAGTSAYLPTFVSSLEPGDPVNLKDHEGRNLGEPLGEYEAVLDYLGLLLRDPEAADILIATLRPLTAEAIRESGHVDLTDVGDFALALAHAAENERAEDRLHAAAVRSLVEQVTVAVGVVTGVGAATVRFGPTARALLAQVVRRSGDTVAGSVGTDSGSGVTIDAAAAGEVMIEIGVYETFLTDPHRFVDQVGDGPLDEAALDAAREAMAVVHEMAADGAGIDGLERALQDVHVEIVRAGGRGLVDALDTGAIAELDHHDVGAVDLDRPLD